MTGSPLRVAFAGLAHSHPYADAQNVRALGAEVVGVYDEDPAAARDFADRFGGSAVASAGDLIGRQADIVIATPRPHEVLPFLETLGTGSATAPVFVNKVIAASSERLNEVDSVVSRAAVPVGTSTVLRFAPALGALAADLIDEEVLGMRVHAQHDNAAFQLPDRAWQDDPAVGGGTLVTVGVHAWEMIDVVLPGATLVSATGWTATRGGSGTASEDAAGVDARMRLQVSGAEVPIQVLVTGLPGPDAYTVEILTSAGVRSVGLDVDDANEALGFRGLIHALLEAGAHGLTVAPWTQARTVVRNALGAAALVRGGA